MIKFLVISFITLYALLMLHFAYGLWRSLFRKKVRVEYSEKDLPLISVVIAFRNEKENLLNLLSALNNQNISFERFEVILVDDYSEDYPESVLDTVKREYQLKLLSLREENLPSGKKQAIEFGVSRSDHSIILITDADCMPSERWVESHASLYISDKIKMAPGIVKYVKGKSFFSSIETIDFYGLIAASVGAGELKMPFICNGANMSFRRDAFFDVGGYNNYERISSGDDVFLLHKFLTHFGSSSITWNTSNNGFVVTSPTNSFSRFFHQRLRWASKSKYYKNKTASIIAFMVLLANISVLSSLFLPALLSSISFKFSLFAILIKLFGDLPLLLIMIHYFKQYRLLRTLLPSALLYPIYTIAIGFASLFIHAKWKGRRIK